MEWNKVGVLEPDTNLAGVVSHIFYLLETQFLYVSQE